MNYCCISDYNYSYKVLTLNHSLSKVMPNYTLTVYCLDNKIFDFLYKFNFPNINLFKVDNIEDENFKKSYLNRSWIEFIWTSTPIIIKHFLENNHEDCIYVDSDLYFYNNPLEKIENNNDYDVLITPHNFSETYKKNELFGKYCVQFIYFKNNKNSKDIIRTWRKQCIDWCYAKYENGKFGDQKYLDDWPHKYINSVKVSSHLGYLAPWNINNYDFKKDNFYYEEKIINPIFYHFHNLNFINSKKIDIGNYEIKKNIQEKIYMDYILIAKKYYDLVTNYSNINIYKDYRNIKSLIKKYLFMNKNNTINI